MTDEQEFLARANEAGTGMFPAHIDLRFTGAADDYVRAEIDLAQHHLAPNGYLHAGVIVTLADTCCGFGVRTGPNGTDAFTTIELKANFLSTVLDGTIVCEARPLHRGRTTEVWDATVTQGERTLASFRCTQLRLSR